MSFAFFIFEQSAYELLPDIEIELPEPDANVIVLFVFNKLSYELPLVTTSIAIPSRYTLFVSVP